MNEMLCGYCDGRNGWFDHSEDCENNPENVITNLQAENERLRAALIDSMDAIGMAMQFSTGETRDKVYTIKVNAQAALGYGVNHEE